MYIRTSNGSNKTTVDIDLTGTEQWRVSLGNRAVSQSSTAGTMQDARNEFGTLPLSLTLMVKGGTKEKNRAIISRILSRMQGKIQVGELKGYDGLVFIGSLKSYTVKPQCDQWHTVALVIDCEQWITTGLPVKLSYHGAVFPFRTFPVNVSAGAGYVVADTVTLSEQHGNDDSKPGIAPTPMSLAIERAVSAVTSDTIKAITIKASSDDTPENNWTIKLRDFPPAHKLELSAPYPGSNDVFAFRYTDLDGGVQEEDPDTVIDTISGWPIYAGGSLDLGITVDNGDGEYENTVTIRFTTPAFKAI